VAPLVFMQVPVVIHNEDLRQVAPLWLSITEQIRSDALLGSSVYVSGMAAK
jgi:hypothetical protein